MFAAMLTASFLAISLSGAALVEEGDRRNLAYTECLFSEVRTAREAAVPVETMLARLERKCSAEREALKQALIAVRQERGDTPAQALASWNRVHANSIEAIRKAYVLRLSELR